MKLLRLFVACCTLSAATVVPGTLFRTAAAQDDLIHIGVSAFVAQAGVYYALELGLFKRAGLNVDIQQYQGGSVVVAAVASGSLQIGGGTPLPLASARERGLPIVLIAPGYIYDSTAPVPDDALAVASQSTATTARDLNDKTIAVTGLKSIDHVAAFGWIDQHGGDSSTVKVVEAPPSAIADALTSGRVAAAEMGQPSLSAALAAGKVKILGKAYDSVARRFFSSSWFSSEDWADKHPDQVKKFNGAINDASAWAQKNPEAAAAVLRKYLHMTIDRAEEHHSRTLDPALIQPILDAAAKYKFIGPMKAADLIWKGTP